jgi:hypothetical protein
MIVGTSILQHSICRLRIADSAVVHGPRAADFAV